MLIKRATCRTSILENCHEGKGSLSFCEIIKGRPWSSGFRYFHDDVLEPGASIGEHNHDGTEEIYFVVEGKGTMILDGKQHPIGPGDLSLVESGHSHGIMNSNESTMRLLVVCCASK